MRNNATFGIGVLVSCGGDKGASFIEAAMSALPVDEKTNERVKDNVTGAIARMFNVAGAAEIEKLVPGFLKRLPLTKDYAEWKTVLGAVELLATKGNKEV